MSSCLDEKSKVLMVFNKKLRELNLEKNKEE